MNIVLIIAAHPDDEVLGCGGASAWHVANGDRVHVVIVAEGATSREIDGDASSHEKSVDALKNAAGNAAVVLGTTPPRFLGLPDNRLDSVDLLDVIKPIEKIVEELRPVIVYTHHAGDLNIDHRVVHQAALTACRPLPGSPVRAIYAFETVSSTEWASPEALSFRPTRFIDISGQIDKKRVALAAYDMEMRPSPHARSMDNVAALATHRGACVGLGAAEAFQVIWERVA